FKNPVGLSAGFDKNAELINILPSIGFGFMEVGSITARQCEGNVGIRLKRLPKKKSIWVNMGLNNKGANAISNKLKNKKFKVPIGISIAKTNCKETTDTEKGINDYIETIKIFESKNIGDFFVLNISCPNSYGGQTFHNPGLYERLLKEIVKIKIKKPIFVKLSPDLSKKNIDKIINISDKYIIKGFVCSNLTKKHSFRKGGLSGKAVEEKANRMIKYIYKKTRGKFIIIGVGGIFSAEDAYKKIKLGASLVELITGLIYQGPGLISKINSEIVKLLNQDNYSNIKEAIGKGIK
ncbi:quinone-dependent dihydroorotate dehydrogenase, partial [Candidatus Pacearchaeota archaeon]|nr:quinone-dependent dihydroorotate dehydrogenase [Candidatus Pacearchaeota archaeon]